ncbi:MAG: ABC transporter substrate-binding protein, partial [Anaerotignaceae bacterium]
ILNVGIIQLIDNGAFEDMREGFIQQLKDKGYDESKVNINYKNAQGDATNLNTISQEMVASNMDLIAAIATPSAQAIVNMETDIPVVFISISNPVGAGIITDMAKPDKNATGTSNAIPVNEIIDLADTLTPGCETYGFLYCTSEINSVTTVENTKAYLDSIGLKYEEAVVTNSSEVQQAAQSLVGRVDAIFVPNDSVIQSAMPLVSEVAMDAKLPVYASSATTVQSGAFATIAISDEEIGRISADMAIEYFEGKSIAEIPAIVVPASETVINQTVADALGIEFSEEVKATAVFITE